jgi:uncharacterized protein (DUF2267 family)
MNQPTIVAKSVEKTNIWLEELAAELGTTNRQTAYQVLRSFLHALRDRLTVEESAQLAAQLPELIRGIYYEGWQPAKTPESYSDIDNFLGRISAEAPMHGETEASYAASAAARVLSRHVSKGEIDDVLATLPPPIRAVFPD